MVEIIFGQDKRHRDKYFSPASFAHPAKMMLPLQRWLIEKYSKPGDVILDPMAGQGTLLIGCTMGRHVIMVELEQKFVQMQNDNWTKIQTLGPEMGYEMGTATILQGDARRLLGVLADVVIRSPPYADTAARDRSKEASYERETSGQYPKHGDLSISRGYQADVIMTSPPYAEAQEGGGIAQEGYTKPYQRDKIRGGNLGPVGKRSYMAENVGNDRGNIQRLPYGNIDCVFTSPPYEGSFTPCSRDPEKRLAKLVEVDRESVRKGDSWAVTSEDALRRRLARQDDGYGTGAGNIGNLRGESYLSAMLEVYQGCCRVLKPQGLMILVTKNFIREKLEVRLDLDTIKLCEQAGFQFVERHYRKLIGQSFWRRIYRQKYPEAPVLNKEDILVFQRKQASIKLTLPPLPLDNPLPPLKRRE